MTLAHWIIIGLPCILLIVLALWPEPGSSADEQQEGPGARETGRGYLGFEIEARYCAAAVQRLSQGTLNFGEAA